MKTIVKITLFWAVVAYFVSFPSVVSVSLPNLQLLYRKSTLSLRSGDMKNVIKTTNEIINYRASTKEQKTILVQLFHLRGHAYHSLAQLSQAQEAFLSAITLNPFSTADWSNLASILIFQNSHEAALKALRVLVFGLHETDFSAQLHRAQLAAGDWQGIDFLEGIINEELRKTREVKQATKISYTEYPYVDIEDVVRTNAAAIHSRMQLHKDVKLPKLKASLNVNSSRPLRIAFISPNWGAHPVGQLLNGVVRSIAKFSGVQIYCISTKKDNSFWSSQLRNSNVEYKEFSGQNLAYVIETLRSMELHIAVDLAGHTLHSGIDIIAHGIAPIRLFFLGYPATTSLRGFSIVDKTVVQYEKGTSHFTEKLIVYPHTYLCSSAPRTQRHIRRLAKGKLHDIIRSIDTSPTEIKQQSIFKPAGSFSENILISNNTQSIVTNDQIISELQHIMRSTGLRDINRTATWSNSTAFDYNPHISHESLESYYRHSDYFVFASFAQANKFSPSLLDTWANILRLAPGSLLWMQIASHQTRSRIQQEFLARGISARRILFTNKLSFSDHLRVKSAASLCLDTHSKSGHSTSIDCLWSGVPLLTVGGERMDTRSGLSLSQDTYCTNRSPFPKFALQTLCTCNTLSATSATDVRDYEQLAVQIANSPAVLRAIKGDLAHNLLHRDEGALFNEQNSASTFVRASKGQVEICNAIQEKHDLAAQCDPKFHLIL